jgi:hypothetical protein
MINKIQCRKCKDIIESVHRHDFKFCKCGSVFVDGGKDYIRRGGDPNDMIDLGDMSDQSQADYSAAKIIQGER